MEKKIKEFSTWHVGIAAEAIAAGQFARLGYDVSVQYGANQKEYDLIIAKDEMLVKISVKGSKDGSWGLTQSHLIEADYHKAIDIWLSKHGAKTIFCFVQFSGKEIFEMPTIYLASIKEIESQLKNSRNGNGGTILYENHTWTRETAVGYGSTEKIPDYWTFSQKRIEQLVKNIS